MIDGEGWTALQLFVRHGSDNGAVVRQLLQAGADPDSLDPRGNAALHAAIVTVPGSPKYGVIEGLLAGGASPCIENADGYTPVQTAGHNTRLASLLDDSDCRAESPDCRFAKETFDTYKSACQGGNRDACGILAQASAIVEETCR